MDDAALHREVDALFRQAKVLRAEGRYTETMAALRAAAELITRHTDDLRRRPGEPPAPPPVTG